MDRPLHPQRVACCYDTVRRALLEARGPHGHWEGRLSTSALSTATAVMALEMVRRGKSEVGSRKAGHRDVPSSGFPLPISDFQPLIAGGLRWLAEHQNADGGWGDTVKSISNISTTMLARAVFHATEAEDQYGSTVEAAGRYIEKAGGVEAVVKRYGKDRTFSAPILTHCALAGLVDWNEVIPLPFELACLPPQFYKTVRLPVVSYALPALIAVGQVRHHFRKPRDPLRRTVRRLAVARSLKVLQRIQPSNGGFLEATPLTSFVTMSLAGMGLADHPVARKGAEFLAGSVRDDGSWPIDTNLATWVTTLSVNALEDDLPADGRPAILEWLLGQQYRGVHPYTNADPGGWAWTDLPGGVPDADDTPGAILALLALSADEENTGRFRRPARGALSGQARRVHDAVAMGTRWLLDLQNRDGGWPTFCRGWGTLPFDRSAPDLTAHAIRALMAWMGSLPPEGVKLRVSDDAPAEFFRCYRAAWAGFRYLRKVQRPDGSWLPLWFGNQYAPNDMNPTYGTSRVLAAFRDAGRLDMEPARRGLRWLAEHQNPDGGWGGMAGIESSIEETALATEALVSADPGNPAAERGLKWLIKRVENGSFHKSAPIGFYFAKLWYFEQLYPLVFTASALRRARNVLDRSSREAREPGPKAPAENPRALIRG